MTIEAASLGPVTAGWLSYTTEVHLDTPELESAYQVNLLTSGVMPTYSGSDTTIADARTAAIYRPDRPTGFTGWRTPTPMLAVKISRLALERELERLLDRPVDGPIAFDISLDVGSGRGAEWAALLRTVVGSLEDPESLVRQPMLAAPLVRSLLTGLLLAAQHQFRDELDRPFAAAAPGAVKRARAYIDANAAEPITVFEIAEAADVSVRSLQQGFKRTLGMSPTAYLQGVRLRRAHSDLLASDPATTTVAEIAARWGFRHGGRFASRYRTTFGVLPTATIRRGR